MRWCALRRRSTSSTPLTARSLFGPYGSGAETISLPPATVSIRSGDSDDASRLRRKGESKSNTRASAAQRTQNTIPLVRSGGAEQRERDAGECACWLTLVEVSGELEPLERQRELVARDPH